MNTQSIQNKQCASTSRWPRIATGMFALLGFILAHSTDGCMFGNQSSTGTYYDSAGTRWLGQSSIYGYQNSQGWTYASFATTGWSMGVSQHYSTGIYCSNGQQYSPGNSYYYYGSNGFEEMYWNSSTDKEGHSLIGQMQGNILMSAAALVQQ